jgi:hypothetical protein
MEEIGGELVLAHHCMICNICACSKCQPDMDLKTPPCCSVKRLLTQQWK